MALKIYKSLRRARSPLSATLLLRLQSNHSTVSTNPPTSVAKGNDSSSPIFAALALYVEPPAQVNVPATISIFPAFYAIIRSTKVPLGGGSMISCHRFAHPRHNAQLLRRCLSNLSSSFGLSLTISSHHLGSPRMIPTPRM